MLHRKARRKSFHSLPAWQLQRGTRAHDKERNTRVRLHTRGRGTELGFRKRRVEEERSYWRL
jgi:hypothetical protein